MESRFDMTNFEQSLREQADQFNMIPSKKVWNGIYNSLHPGSIWPSISMLLLFLLALVGIGPLNNASNSFKTNSTDNFKADLLGNSEITTEEALKSEGIFSIKNYLYSDKTSLNSTNLPQPGKVISLQSNLQRNKPGLQDQGNITAIKIDIAFNNTVNEKSFDNSGSFLTTQSLNSSRETNEILPVKSDVIYNEIHNNYIQTLESKGLNAEGVENALGDFYMNEKAQQNPFINSFINTEMVSCSELFNFSVCIVYSYA